MCSPSWSRSLGSTRTTTMATDNDLNAQDINAESVAVRSRVPVRRVDLVSVDVAPTIAPGVAAPIGSLAMLTTGGLYQKTGAADTAWTLNGTGSGTVGPGTPNT